MKHAYELQISFHHQGELSVGAMLDELQRFAACLPSLSENLTQWLLGGDTKESALLYEAFKDGKPTAAAQAVLETLLAEKTDPRCIVIWNGLEKHRGASVRFYGRPADHMSLVTFVGRPQSFSPDWHAIAAVIKTSALIWAPDHIALESNGYQEHKVFKDRPGVGWMLYLPQALNAMQVPEARALVPVDGLDASGKKMQIGTIIVSVTDEPFSDENPEHVKIANAIEIRLADQDLLPRYANP